MKHVLLALSAIVFICSETCAQTYKPTYQLSIQNQRVNGTQLKFDVFIRNTDATAPIYFDGGDFVFDFNSQYFTNPTLRIMRPLGTKISDTSRYYYFPVINKNLAGNLQIAFGLSSEPLSFVHYDSVGLDDQRIIDEITANIQTLYPGDSVQIAECIVSGISATSGTAGLKWNEGTVGDFTTLVGAYVKTDTLDGNDGRWLPVIITPLAKDTAGQVMVVRGEDIVLSNETAIKEANNAYGSQNSFFLQPNPSKDYIDINALLPVGTVSIRVNSLLGETVIEQFQQSTTEAFALRLPIADIVPGVYFITVKCEGRGVTQIFVKE